jgi:hypothetical protein
MFRIAEPRGERSSTRREKHHRFEVSFESVGRRWLKGSRLRVAHEQCHDDEHSGSIAASSG